MKYPIALAYLSMIILMGCTGAKLSDLPVGDNSRTSLDWNGIYRGIMPCNGCDGLKVELTLFSDHTYVLRKQFQNKDDSIYIYNGKILWSENGDRIQLENYTELNLIQVGENQLFILDEDGKRRQDYLKDLYVLKKDLSASEVTDKYWKLIELNGRQITVKKVRNREAHIRLQSENLRAVGNGGCNAFNSRYEIFGGGGIQFGEASTNRMTCLNITFEGEYLKMLEYVNNYLVKNDTLFLKQGPKTVLAKFTYDYFN